MASVQHSNGRSGSTKGKEFLTSYATTSFSMELVYSFLNQGRGWQKYRGTPICNNTTWLQPECCDYVDAKVGLVAMSTERKPSDGDEWKESAFNTRFCSSFAQLNTSLRSRSVINLSKQPHRSSTFPYGAVWY
jgi:hypothetical protein